MNKKLDVVAWLDAFSQTLPESPGDAKRLRDIRDTVKERIDADTEYDLAFTDWERATSGEFVNMTDERWAQVADRFEAAVMRRIAALAKATP